MAGSFLGSEEYDERAHRLFDDGEYDLALDTLKEGLRLHPSSVELFVGLGYTRLAREEFVWAKQAFERAIVLDPEHEDAYAGLGEVLLRFGQHERALQVFARARELCGHDLELLLQMGRALYRDGRFPDAHLYFTMAVLSDDNSAEAAAALGYTLYRIGEVDEARREVLRSLRLDKQNHEARIYLGHILYDSGDWHGALLQFQYVPPHEYWDALAVARVIELKRALKGAEPGGNELAQWRGRLDALDGRGDPIAALLESIGATVRPADER